MLKKFDYDKIPVVDIVNEILVDSSKRGASDIHFDPHEKFMKVRIRIDGELIDYTEIPNDVKKNLVTRIKILSEMNITESRLPQDGAIKGRIEDVNLDLRVSVLPTNMGEKVVIRILDYTLSVTGIEQLGFSERNLEKVLKMINVPNGIILVTGATGTGKSTTVYSILQILNKENTNIITVEDPIEMDIEGINQVQTNSEIGLTFATALRSILRQDPNIIMIGEIRDTETARIAVRASITGHLVLSTIHTNNSLNTIERLLDMDVERYLLASALTGIISQKLARKLCPHCRKLRPASDYEKELFKKVLNKDIKELYDNVGCDECSSGFKGRIALQEVLLINQEIRDAISNNVRKNDLRHLVYRAGVTTLLQDGLEKVLTGDTTFEEVLKLIELDDEDLKEGHGLEKAIDDTNLSRETENNLQNEQKVTHQNIDEKVEEPKSKKQMPINDLDDVKPAQVEQSKSTNLESFLASTQNLINKRSENTNNNTTPIETPMPNYEPIKESIPTVETKLDDYGLNETINFINEYKRGLKNFNNNN